jgi:pSer/pThr/pTyr-binding forkhead associated (FHA) protein
MALRLVSCAGRADILVGGVSVVVGRHPRSDSRVHSPRVSRWHCSLTEVEGGLWVHDLGSSNGTWINGRRVVSALVRPGDVIAIADVCFRLEKAEPDRARVTDSECVPGTDGLSHLDRDNDCEEH